MKFLTRNTAPIKVEISKLDLDTFLKSNFVDTKPADKF